MLWLSFLPPRPHDAGLAVWSMISRRAGDCGSAGGAGDCGSAGGAGDCGSAGASDERALAAEGLAGRAGDLDLHQLPRRGEAVEVDDLVVA